MEEDKKRTGKVSNKEHWKRPFGVNQFHFESFICPGKSESAWIILTTDPRSHPGASHYKHSLVLFVNEPD